MAGTRRKCITMQGLGYPVSAAGQGGKAGPQASSSCDRSSLLVGDLANKEYSATRKTFNKKVLQTHDCHMDHDTFCYICAKFEVSSLRKPIDVDIRQAYEEIFKLKMDQLSNWVPHTICDCCQRMLTQWKKDKSKNCIKYSSPAIWRSPTNKEECYFCLNQIKGYNKKYKHKIVYKSTTSVIAPVLIKENKCETKCNRVCEDIQSMEIDEQSSETNESEIDDNNDSDTEYAARDKKPAVPPLISQLELNDLVRELGLPKDGSEHLSSFLKAKNLLEPKTKVSLYRNREKEFLKFFTKDEKLSLVFCTDVEGLINALKANCYKATDWRLFIDSSKRSIKAVLLHNTNVYAPVPIAHSTIMQEKYDNMQILLQKIDYNKHLWQICGDLKIITMLLGQQSGFTKHPCYLCLWDSRDRAKHYKQKEWPVRSSLTTGSYNIIHKSLVDPSKILIPPLHIKLGLMKQFVKALDKTGECFRYLQSKFPNLSEAKVKEGIFDGPQIRTMFKDENFTSKMNGLEKGAWLSFKDVAQNFLGNTKSPQYKKSLKIW